jgi:cellulose synthase/poly-beta-1,6-N-acetylglucosamine synthase-like glycosyltransferase
MSIFQAMTVFILIFLLLLIAYGFLIDYYRRGWNAIPEVHSRNEQFRNVHVSLVIPVRNEARNVRQLFDAVLSQNYPAGLLEVIFVDDHSEDGTWETISAFTATCSLLKIQLPDEVSGKKAAVAAGIARASGELIVTTDADCRFSAKWISSLVNGYVATNAKFIAAPVKMISGKNFIGIFQSLDFLTLQAITGASVFKKFHTLCNGANIAYTKDAFVDVNGFSGIDTIPSGDDMLLMYKIYRQYPADVHYLKNRDAIVETPAEPSLKRFFNQRIRWASKAVHYDDKKVLYVLMLVYLVNISFLAMIVASIIDGYWLSFLLLFFVMKLLIEFPFVNAAAGFFNMRKLMPFFPLMQPFHILYTVIAGWLGRFGSYEWKSRTIKNKGKAKPAKL